MRTPSFPRCLVEYLEYRREYLLISVAARRRPLRAERRVVSTRTEFGAPQQIQSVALTEQCNTAKQSSAEQVSVECAGACCCQYVCPAKQFINSTRWGAAKAATYVPQLPGRRRARANPCMLCLLHGSLCQAICVLGVLACGSDGRCSAAHQQSPLSHIALYVPCTCAMHQARVLESWLGTQVT